MSVDSHTTNSYGYIVSGSRVNYNGEIYDVGECDGKYCNLYQNGQFKIGVVPCGRDAIDTGVITPTDALLESAVALSTAKLKEL